MRNLTLYFLLLTNFVFSNVEIIKPSPVISEKGEVVSDKEVEINFKNSLFGHYVTFQLSILSSDNRYIIVITKQKYNRDSSKILIYDFQTKKLLKTINNTHKNNITAIASYRDYLFTGGDKGIVKIWEVTSLLKGEKKEAIQPFYEDNLGKVNKIYVDEKYIIADFIKDEQGIVKRKILTKEKNNTEVLSFSPLIADYNLISKKKEYKDKEKKYENYKKIIFTTNYKNKIISYKNNKNEIVNYNIDIKKRVDLLPFKDNEFILKNKYHLIKNNKNIVLYWKDKKLFSIEENPNFIKSISISSDENFMVITKEYEVVVYNIFDRDKKIATYRHRPLMESMVFTEDDKYLIASTNTGYLHIWDLNKSKLHRVIKIHNRRITSIDINNDNKLLATGSHDDYIKVWKIDELIKKNKIEPIFSKQTKYNVDLLYFEKDKILFKNPYHDKKTGKLIKGMDIFYYKNDIFNQSNQNCSEIDSKKYLKSNKILEVYLKDKKRNKKGNALTSFDKKKNNIFYGKEKGELFFNDISLKNEFNVKSRIVDVKIGKNLLASTDYNGNINIYKQDGKLLKILSSRDDGSWFVLENNKRVYRGGDSFLFQNKNEIDKVNSLESDITFPKKITLIEGEVTNFDLEIKNRNKYNIKNIQLLLEHDKFTLIPNRRDRDGYFLFYNSDNKQLEYELNFRVKNNNYILARKYLVKVIIKKPIIDIDYVTINEEDKIELNIKNSGNQNVSNINWIIDNKSLPIRQIEMIESNSKIKKSCFIYTIDKNLSIDFFHKSPPYQIWNFNKNILYKPSVDIKIIERNNKPIVVINNKGKDINASFTIDIFNRDFNISESNILTNLKRGKNKIGFDLSKYTKLKDKEKIEFDITVKYNRIIWRDRDDFVMDIAPTSYFGMSLKEIILICIFIIMVIFVYYYYSIKNFIEEPKKLFDIVPLRLTRIIFRLRLFGRLDEVLSELSINREQVKFIISFLENGFKQKNIDYYSKIAKVKIASIKKSKNLYRVNLEEDFSLSLQSFYLYIKRDNSKLDLDINEIKDKLTLVISTTKKSREEMVAYKEASNLLTDNQMIIPTTIDIMKLLLNPNYINALEVIFVKYLEPKYISPFSSKLFLYRYRDREKINIQFELNKKIKNFIIIGNKGIGKTYLLNILKDTLGEQQDIEIAYIKKESLDEMKLFIEKKVNSISKDKKLLFFIDNADYLIKDKSTYEIFEYFKEVNYKKNIFFIMTGFWELYEELNIKEKSVLKNFAETKMLRDKLDKDVAKEMITTAMDIAKVKYISSIIDEIIIKSGRKWTLINLICQELLNSLDRDNRTIENKKIEDVCRSQKFIEEIKRLKNIDDRFERIIIYLVSDKKKFTFEELSSELHEYGIQTSINETKNHLKKLWLNDIFVKNGNYFMFNIPHLQKMFKEDKVNLFNEIKELNNYVPIVNIIKENPTELKEVIYLNLYKVYKQLEKTKVIDLVVEKLKIEKNSLKIVKDAFQSGNNKFDKLVSLFVDRLNFKYEKKENCYLILIPKDFPLMIQEFNLYFTKEKSFSVNRSQFDGEKVTLIININSVESQNRFHEKSLDKSDKFIAPKSDEITKLFLEPNPKELLLDIFSKHLSLENISPYQITKGVDNATIFFGRERIIKDITQRNPRNYLIVGSRRIGKSSILKAIDRIYSKRQNIESFYFTLSDSNLEEKLIDELSFKDKKIKKFSELKAYLKSQNKRYICLIDEADDFIKEDKRQDYKFLKVLRAISDDGVISFILAGFWQLYQSKFEHQSPLFNFGDFIEIEELEQDACTNLIREPMSVMNILFQSNALIEKIVMKTGQKAQLISLICQELLEKKNRETIKINGIKNTLITESDVDEVLKNSKKLRNELVKWIELEKNDKRGKLLRILIGYSMLDRDNFTSEDVQIFLKSHDIYIDVIDLSYHLELLVLSFFFKEDKNLFTFRVPLQKELLQEDIVEIKIGGIVFSLVHNYSFK